MLLSTCTSALFLGTRQYRQHDTTQSQHRQEPSSRAGVVSSKHAARGYFDRLRTEVSRDGVKVTTVHHYSGEKWQNVVIATIAAARDCSERFYFGLDKAQRKEWHFRNHNVEAMALYAAAVAAAAAAQCFDQLHLLSARRSWRWWLRVLLLDELRRVDISTADGVGSKAAESSFRFLTLPSHLPVARPMQGAREALRRSKRLQVLETIPPLQHPLCLQEKRQLVEHRRR